MKPKGFSLFQPGPVAVVFGKPIASSSHALDRRDELHWSAGKGHVAAFRIAPLDG